MPALTVTDCATLIDKITAIAADAAEAIVALAGRADVRTKADGSPATAADDAAEAIICKGLGALATGLPIISEEQASAKMPAAIASGSYFLVDPLDGTREFIAGRDEYTVNIAIMTDRLPRLGIICAPSSGRIWRGIVGKGADKIAGRGTNKPTAIRVRSAPPDGIEVLASRSHLDPQTQAFLKELPQPVTLVQAGSSIKFCRIAEGDADLYPRLSPTHDWDIAAGHAILQAAGGNVTNPQGGSVVYGSASLLVPAFVARGGIKD